MKNVLQSKIASRLTFYLGILAVIMSVVTVSMPDWRAVGITPTKFLQAADTCFLMCIAILLAQLVDQARDK